MKSHDLDHGNDHDTDSTDNGMQGGVISQQFFLMHLASVLLQSPLFIWSHQIGHCHQLAHDLSCIRSFTRQFIVYSRRALGLQFWYRCRHFSSCTVVQVGFCLCIKRFPYSNCGKNKSFLATKLISVGILCHGWADNLIIPVQIKIYLVTMQHCRTTIIHKLYMSTSVNTIPKTSLGDHGCWLEETMHFQSLHQVRLAEWGGQPASQP